MATLNYVLTDLTTSDVVSIPVKNLKWAYNNGTNYTVDYLDARTGAELSIKVDGTDFATIGSVALSGGSGTFDNPPAPFRISDANVVIGYFGASEVSIPDFADYTEWTGSTTGSGAFTVTALEGSATFVGNAVSGVSTRSLSLSTALVPDGQAFTWTIPLGTVTLDSKVLGTDFDVLFYAGDTLAHTLTAGDISAEEVVITGVTETDLEIRVSTLLATEDYSGVSIALNSGTISIETDNSLSSGNNCVIEYNFNDEAFAFGVDQLPRAIAGTSEWFNVEAQLAIMGGSVGLGADLLYSHGTVISILENPSDATECFVAIDKPQAGLTVKLDATVTAASTYFSA